MTDKFEFQVGDIVEFGGVKGIIDEIDLSENYPLRVKFDDDMPEIFTKDGRFSISHTEPLLKLIERPKKKKMVKKTIERWANIYPGEYTILWLTEKEANNNRALDRIACVKLTGSYDLEVDEDNEV